MKSEDPRLQSLQDWLRDDLKIRIDHIEPASSDASFRRYFRVLSAGVPRIAMDAPPPQEDVRPFIRIARLLAKAGLRTPTLLASDTDRGFLLLEDFGRDNYLDLLNEETAESLYDQALESLLRLQQRVSPQSAQLPEYDRPLLRRELDIFRDWLIEAFLQLPLSPAELAMLEATWKKLIDSALEQPRVCVHRDFHSRNLMALDPAGAPGLLDFQDALIGPITYDAVSLLRDCYIAWPEARVSGWLDRYHEALLESHLLDAREPARFRRWFDLMGMQRHLKAAGIFARLQLRDGKPDYLKDIPRTVNYLVEVGRTHPDFGEFVRFLEERIRPGLAAKGLT
jgi:aminoglycoside/choline kinase family phosphotransferase